MLGRLKVGDRLVPGSGSTREETPVYARSILSGVARGILIVGMAIAIALILYAPRLSDYFALDDFIWLNAVSSQGFGTLIVREFTFPAATPFEAPSQFWRPAAGLFFYAEYSLFGLNPIGYHVVNVLLHGLFAALVGVLFLRLMGSLAGAIALSMLIVVWPSYEFAVTWISQFSELMAMVLVLGALLMYHAFLTASRGFSAVLVALTTLSLAVGYMSKESAIIGFPLLILVTLATPESERRRSMREIVMAFIPLALVTAIYGTFAFVHEYLSIEGESYALGWHVLENGWYYLERMGFPHTTEAPAADRARVALGAGFLALGVFALAARQRVPVFFFLWSLLGILPFSGFHLTEWRYTYVATAPFLGFVVSECVCAMRALPGRAQKPLVSVLLAAAIVVGLMAAQQSRKQQSWIHGQSVAYAEMIAAVREQCVPLPPDAFVYVVDSNTFDLYGINTTSALNIEYERVRVGRGEPHPLAVLSAKHCVARVRDRR